MTSEILASPLGTTNMPNFNDHQTSAGNVSPLDFSPHFAWFPASSEDHISISTGAFPDMTEREEGSLLYNPEKVPTESDGLSPTPETLSWKNTFLD